MQYTNSKISTTLSTLTLGTALGLSLGGLACVGEPVDLGERSDTSTDEIGDGETDMDVGTDDSAEQGESGDEVETDSETDSETGLEGPAVHIHVRATGDDFDHMDGFAGQTPQDYFYGIRSLTLYREPGDPEPMLVFDYGSDYVEASYAPGADTVVASVLAQDLEADTFTYARVTVSHVRLRIDATMHALDLDIPGAFDIIHVLGGDTSYGGETHDQGWWRYIFDAGLMQFPLKGQGGGPGVDAPIGAPISVVEEEGETALYFAIDLPVDPNVAEDVDIVMEFNVDDCFRWQDGAGEGYLEDVFDATPVGPEPITRMGANDSALYYE